MLMRTLILAGLGLTASPVLAQAPAAPVVDVQFLIDQCDRVMSHPADPDRQAPGLERPQINLPAAEAICRTAHEASPMHARTNYHLGRAIYYQGRHTESLPFLEAATTSGYPQAIFVLGFTLSLGGQIPTDFCRAETLWRQAVSLDHPWSAFHLIEKQLDGKFETCKGKVSQQEMAELSTFMQQNITIGASRGRVEALASRLKK